MLFLFGEKIVAARVFEILEKIRTLKEKEDGISLEAFVSSELLPLFARVSAVVFKILTLVV